MLKMYFVVGDFVDIRYLENETGKKTKFSTYYWITKGVLLLH